MDLKVDGFKRELCEKELERLDECRNELIDFDELEDESKDEFEDEINDFEEYEKNMFILDGLVKSLIWGGSFAQLDSTLLKGMGLSFSIFKENVPGKMGELKKYVEKVGASFDLPLVLITLIVFGQLVNDDAVDPSIREMAEDLLSDEMLSTTLCSLFAHNGEEIFVSRYILKQLYLKITSQASWVELLIQLLETNTIIKGWYLYSMFKNNETFALVINHDHAGEVVDELIFKLF